MQDAIIRTENLTKKFDEEIAVDGVTFSVPQGAIFGFIGPSGSGKTTTIRMLTGIIQPTSGAAEILGQSPNTLSGKTKMRVGYMPQLFALYPELSVRQNMNFAASIYGMGPFRRKRSKSLLDFVELTEHRSKPARKISGGMQRRLSLAATLVHDPELIFLDEPTAGIDPVLRRKFWDYFGDLHKKGRTLFITTQYVSEAAYCDLVGVMSNGRLLVVDTPEGLTRRAYGGEIVELKSKQSLPLDVLLKLESSGLVKKAIPIEEGWRMTVDEASSTIPELIEQFRSAGFTVDSIERFQPRLDDVFVEIVRKDRK